MTLDPTELNPMWTPRLEGSAVTCRIALTAVDADALSARAGVEVTRVPTFDAPLALLADDAALAARLSEAGVRVPRAAGTYAERQWDAREGAEEFAHRVFDHAEFGTGVTDLGGLEARYAVVTASGADAARQAMTALLSDVAASGTIIDVRRPADLRVFVLATLERKRCILVRDSVEERVLAADLSGLVEELVRDAD